jgi:flagellar motor component MotA
VQILGLIILAFVVRYGFAERADTTISAFDGHAAVMVLVGSLSAVMISSTAATSLRTFTALRELVPGAGTLGKGTDTLEADRQAIAALWREGKRAQAVELAERSAHPAIRRMLDLVLSRAPHEATTAAFTELKHAELTRWQPAVGNWELLAKLAPSFGMVGTITGMIQLFKSMGETTNLGASLSLGASGHPLRRGLRRRRGRAHRSLLAGPARRAPRRLRAL